MLSRWRNRRHTQDTRQQFASPASGVVQQRQYADYGEYVTHQKSKLEERGLRIRELSLKKQRDKRFRDKFAPVVRHSEMRGQILCLGARLGEEVRAYRMLGFDAIGVDLNPGTGNTDVIQGDFHALPWPADSFDNVYSNVLDHVLDLHKFMSEISRVLRPGGKVYFDLTGGYEETGAVDPWGALIWPRNEDLVRTLGPWIQSMIYDCARKNERQIVFTVVELQNG